ncbi:hypothetical protein A3G55_03710 [Candidatus Giovannonibacteria bacterium RIFCSPLOWO2_12_FULL_44_25]|uniref:Uncharacterized protein n=3 Tax=Parcubacteria group TaxID=1794811 RepID=A0A837IJ35_9BACT|nr:MAG: hypothetical protein UW15_C0031G0004 [Parcubacteria group bacterium GW2011_GWC1_44_10]KKT59129.1 MAG: hypothetical protein UW53_C0021G0004 [Candidatus Giovannonibacteria bacterium GW2011_GWA1_44_25]KKU11963.1 MAG: hypothetical protein UX18_C0037G0003 [Candidatus Azambacteria bacterium GW2011_GWC2_45_7b]KKU28987.1 MAG: hypothetical protein UX43_C0017G0004 [Candidatus Giovannonibacteria bacterium GW2011_GWB1_46_20]OGF49666.1 MAG: hypothetical protein A2120_01850 [Candidatus Giovannonibact
METILLWLHAEPGILGTIILAVFGAILSITIIFLAFGFKNAFYCDRFERARIRMKIAISGGAIMHFFQNAVLELLEEIIFRLTPLWFSFLIFGDSWQYMAIIIIGSSMLFAMAHNATLKQAIFNHFCGGVILSNRVSHAL